MYIIVICHWAILHYNMSFKTIAGRSDGVFWWFPALSEDQEKICWIHQNYLVALISELYNFPDITTYFQLWGLQKIMHMYHFCFNNTHIAISWSSHSSFSLLTLFIQCQSCSPQNNQKYKILSIMIFHHSISVSFFFFAFHFFLYGLLPLTIKWSLRQLRARRALSIFKDVLWRARRARTPYDFVQRSQSFCFSMEHLWIVIAPFWLSTDDLAVTISAIGIFVSFLIEIHFMKHGPEQWTYL